MCFANGGMTDAFLQWEAQFKVGMHALRISVSRFKIPDVKVYFILND